MNQNNNTMDSLGLPQDLIWDSDPTMSLTNGTNARYEDNFIFPDSFAYGNFFLLKHAKVFKHLSWLQFRHN